MEAQDKKYSIYDSVFMSQTLLEGSYPLANVDSVPTSTETKDDIQSLSVRKYRIFICTTMYQEAQHEMDRLLKSLSKIADSNKLIDHGIYIESHIFLDNGANGFEIKQFGVQLLALMEDNFEFCKEPGTIVHTPYGIQLSWERNPDMSLFIHLKDNEKVKAKKRWSQVMYMKYVLEYRSKVVGDGSKFKPVLKSNSAYSLFHNSTESLDQGIDMRMFTTYKPTNTEILVDGMEDNNMHTLQVPKVVFGNSSDTSSIHSLVEYGSESGIHFSVDDEITQSRHETGSLDRDSNESRLPSFILSTDADMAFDDECVLDLLNTINKYPEIGGVCGRTFPKGVHQHPIVWLQMFDYAKDFWMIKSAQNIIGSVMCCPGCLSLYRFQAVKDVLQTYSESTQTMEDVFTKDNGEDRWMCTLMMLKGWELRYTYHGRNTTYCPEETVEFMKQRRRWLLSDFANAAVVLRNLKNLMVSNNAFTFIYVVYLIQLFLIMILYPGSTIIMLSLGLELASGLPLIIATPVLAFVPVFYCVILMYNIRQDIEVTIAKLLIFILGAGTLYIFTATSVIVVRDVYDDYQTGNISHIEHMILIAFMGSYIYAALLHPREAWILICGLPYLFYLPLLNIFLPLYAVCNIVDQSWGTRDGENVLSNLFHFICSKSNYPNLLSNCKASSYASLSSSAPDLTDYKTEFWTKIVKTLVGKDVNISISGAERDIGLHKLRKKAVAVFLLANGIWILLLCGFYAFLLQLLDNKSTYGIVMGALMGLSPLIQMCGMTVYRLYDTFSIFGHVVSR
ncbi:LOW QUALITY PROTEIN: hypothetical protein KUTeg_008114 [Tegillarca granosa]|uniref:chitin synthase n=1 Tax=Tegillarca granosa TaxID=220873 RepID=A0ABQ9F869_TEGGR|nr:LOW QUALITY PROTEIN: hypothetical protein KUTeg_008114 [Tegillarca granosa]